MKRYQSNIVTIPTGWGWVSKSRDFPGFVGYGSSKLVAIDNLKGDIDECLSNRGGCTKYIIKSGNVSFLEVIPKM